MPIWDIRPCTVILEPLDPALVEWHHCLTNQHNHASVKTSVHHASQILDLKTKRLQENKSPNVITKRLREKKRVNYNENQDDDEGAGALSKRSCKEKREEKDAGALSKRSCKEKREEKNDSLSPFELMVLKNTQEKLAFLESLKIDEAKAGYFEAVSKIKPKPVRRKITPSKRPDVLRKSSRTSKVNINYSEAGIFERLQEAAEKEEKLRKMREELPHVLGFREALTDKGDGNVYRNLKEDIVLDDPNTVLKPVDYAKYDFKNLVCDESTISRLLKCRNLSSLDIHSSVENIIVCVGSKSGEIALHKFGSGYYYEFKPHVGRVTNIKFNPSYAEKFASSSTDGTLRYADLETKLFMEIFKDFQKQYCLHFDYLSPETFLIARRDGYIVLSDSRTSRKQGDRFLFCHDQPVKCVDVHPVDKNYFITAANGRCVRLWDVRNMRQKPLCEIHPESTSMSNYVASAYFSPRSGEHVLVTSDSHISLYHCSLSGKKLNFLRKRLLDFSRKAHVQLSFKHWSQIQARWLPNTNHVFAIVNGKGGIRICNSNIKETAVVGDYFDIMFPCFKAHPYKPLLAACSLSSSLYVFKEN